MKVTALDTHDGHREGDMYEVADAVAVKLIRKGLVKAGPVPLNKMAPPSDNKSNPTSAAGKAHTSSSSPAAPALAQATPIPLDDGGSTAEQVAAVTGRRPRGRPPGTTKKQTGASSP